MNEKIDNLIRVALEEDLGERGDITTMALFDEDAPGNGHFVAEQEGILSGVDVLQRSFFIYDHSVIVKLLKEDGQNIKKGEVIAEAKGRIRSLLAVERTALNFLSHLSGIATLTNAFVEEIKDINCKLMDTRKTVPGLRLLEKMAVKNGGGLNHRIGLFDGILIKDNHLAAIKSAPSPLTSPRRVLTGEGQGGGDLAKAVNLAKKKYPGKPIEIEVENLQQVKEALDAGADILLLDNMEINQIKQSVELVGRVPPARQCLAQAGGPTRRIKTEASGGVSLQNVREIAQTGVDYISTSAITMAASLINLKFEISL